MHWSKSGSYLQSNLIFRKYARAARGHYSKITAKLRANMQHNKGTFYADGEILFCRTCRVPIDHSRQSNLDQHVRTAKHVNSEDTDVPKKCQKSF